jgi:hypothetical protein
LRAALDYLVPFAAGETTWRHPQITPFEVVGLVPLLDRAAIVWQDDHYRAIADRLRSSVSMPMRPRFDLAAFERARNLSAADAFPRGSRVTVTRGGRRRAGQDRRAGHGPRHRVGAVCS